MAELVCNIKFVETMTGRYLRYQCRYIFVLLLQTTIHITEN